MNSADQESAPRKYWREWLVRAALVIVSLTLTFLLAEGLSRLFVPLSERRDNITLDGRRIEDFLTPGIVYRQVSNEYDALTTITTMGNRVPEVEGNPDIVFIGDSFTFGFGLNDEDTFVSIYCRKRNLSCANLGQPGSGTLRQVERLEQFLVEHDWHPREVRLFFFGMSGSFSAGNDFVDNYYRERRMRNSGAIDDGALDQVRGAAERIIGLQGFLLRQSNLVRLAKFYAGPLLKSMLIAEPGEARMALSLEATRKALARLDELSRQAGFDFAIYLLVPVHDILRGTDGDTLATVNSVSPKPAVPTAHLFTESPAEFYFAFDGHLNPKGSRRIAEFMLSRDPSDAP